MFRPLDFFLVILSLEGTNGGQSRVPLLSLSSFPLSLWQHQQFSPFLDDVWVLLSSHPQFLQWVESKQDGRERTMNAVAIPLFHCEDRPEYVYVASIPLLHVFGVIALIQVACVVDTFRRSLSLLLTSYPLPPSSSSPSLSVNSSRHLDVCT